MSKNNISEIARLGGALLEAIPDMFILFDQDAAILDILHPKEELMEGCPEDFSGFRLTDKNLPQGLRMGADYFKEVVRTHRSCRYVFRHVGNKSGKIRYYEVILSYLATEYILADIRTLHEDSLARMESDHLHCFFTEVLDNIAIPVMVKSMDSECYIFWGKKAELFGRTAGEMVGGTEELFMPKAKALQVQQLDRELASGKEKQYQGIEKYTVRDGKEHTFVVTRTLFSFGAEKLILASVLDISELKETQTSLLHTKDELASKNMMLSSVLSVAQVIPWYGDLKNGMFACDYKDYHHEEAGSPDEKGEYRLTFERFFSRIHPDYQEHAIGQFSDLVKGRLSEFHEVYPIHWYNDREYEWLETQSSIPGYSADGEPLRLIGSARVITAQKQMEESLREAKEQAERSNTLKSAFLANMSHEIRTPLNAIVGFSELLADAGEEEEKKEYLTIIRNSNALLLQLVGDILDLSKIEAGTLEFSFADYDLNEILVELEQTARMKVADSAIEVSCKDRLTECTIHTDRGRLLQVMHNFINNAAKFTSQGHIYFGCRQQTNGYWYFYVEDTGCGIPADKADHVFERFVKLDNKAKGTGLGLAISKSIVERLGGEIGVASSEGVGSTFWFTLPEECIASSVAKEKPGNEKQTPSGEEEGRITLLIAEDDAANYKLFEAILKKHYKLLHAWNGLEAVEMFTAENPDVILMDIKMPVMDGYEAISAIRKLSPDIPIVAVTAFAYPEDMRRILSSGFNGCLPKPVSADGLKKKIAELYPACCGRSCH